MPMDLRDIKNKK